jgi:hypothetical protein
MKKRNLIALVLVCCIATSMMLRYDYVHAEREVIISVDERLDIYGEEYLLDSHEDDAVPCLLDIDDFDTYEEYARFKKEHPNLVVPESKGLNSPKSSKPIKVNATLGYTLKGLTADEAIQKSCQVGNYIYITLHEDADTRISRCLINKANKEATVIDYMTITGGGHGQTLEYVGDDSRGNPQFIVGCKASTASRKNEKGETVYDHWSLQIGRVTYSAGTTLKYTDIPRLASIAYANKDNTPYDSAKRVDAAVSTDLSTLVIWMKSDKGNIQYSFYDMDGINDAFDAKEAQNSKYIYCYDSVIRDDLICSYQQSATNAILPNDSFQGIELENNGDLKISGGKKGQTPMIAVVSGKMNSKTKSYSCNWLHNAIVTNSNDFSGDKLEIEGLQINGGYTDCVIRDMVYTRNTGKYRIYKIQSSNFTSNNY